MTTPNPEDPAKFSNWLAQHNYGLTDAEATTVLADLMRAVSSRDKAGTMTLKIGIVPRSGAVEITVAIDAKEPREAPDSRLYYLSPEGLPTRRDPMQPNIPGTVPAEEGNDAP